MDIFSLIALANSQGSKSPFNFKGSKSLINQLPITGENGDTYKVEENNHYYAWGDNGWVDIGNIFSPDSINNENTFIAYYNTTTYDEITTAINDNKIIFVDEKETNTNFSSAFALYGGLTFGSDIWGDYNGYNFYSLGENELVKIICKKYTNSDSTEWSQEFINFVDEASMKLYVNNEISKLKMLSFEEVEVIS